MPADQIVIINDVSELRRMTRWLRERGDAADIAPALLHPLDICANEAVMNIISYAYDDGGCHDITLELKKTLTGAMLIIRDDGKPFNLLEEPEYQIPANLDDARIGGLGIHLIRRLLTHWDYQRERGFNVLSLVAERKLRPGNA